MAPESVVSQRLARVGMTLLTWTLALLILPGPAAGPTLSAAGPHPTTSRKGPNVLLLVGDDHGGGTLGIDGDPRQATPRLDGLARQGVRFDRAYCNSPVCSASRQSFLTGKLPHAVGVTQLLTPLPEEAITLGEWLGAHGYETAAYGKMHFNGRSNHGFDERIDLDQYFKYRKSQAPPGGFGLEAWRPFIDPAAAWLNAGCRPEKLPAALMDSTYFADHAIKFLCRPHDRPFLMVASFYDPHAPFHFPREWAGRFRPDQFDVPPISPSDRLEAPDVFRSLTPCQVQGIQAAYYTSLSFVDYQVGRVLDALEATGLAEDTIVIYLGDNGYMRGQHGRFEKHCFYEPAVRVPLIIRWPGKIAGNRRVAELVELVDVMPTLLDLLGFPQPPHLHGISQASRLKSGVQGPRREVAFSEYLENEEAMVRSEHYKLIVGTGRRQRKDGLKTARSIPGAYEKLYDLDADPNETTDLSARPDLAAVKADLRHRLHERLVTTREGREPVPSGLSEIEAIHWCLVPRDVGHYHD